MGKANQVRLASWILRNHDTDKLCASSAILKAIAEKLIPGIPENLNIMLADQVQDDKTSDQSGKKCVVQFVLESDKKRAVAMEEYNCESCG
jgi:hypothetical protein